MAKRARGSHRPGQRPPLQRSTAASSAAAATPVATPRPTTLTPQEEARAAELEAQIVADERAAEEARRRTDKRRGPAVDPAPRETLALTAADEYAYVGRDVRRITLIGGSLIGLLLVLFAISQVTGAGPI
jgi:hypothetical protein